MKIPTGPVRDYFPKGTSFATRTNNDVQRVVRILNDRPRKRLNYLTPREVFENKGCVLGVNLRAPLDRRSSGLMG